MTWSLVLLIWMVLALVGAMEDCQITIKKNLGAWIFEFGPYILQVADPDGAVDTWRLCYWTGVRLWRRNELPSGCGYMTHDVVWQWKIREWTWEQMSFGSWEE